MIARAPSAVLDEFGRPFESDPPAPLDFAGDPRLKRVLGSYDAAADDGEFKYYWQHADSLDADSANRRAVRQKLVPRSRYETDNNGFADGITQTHCNYTVGKGPALRLQTRNKEFNQVVERLFVEWAKAIQLRRKLWCMCHARVQDGEAFGLFVNNKGNRHRVQLDLVLIETEQCQTPMLPIDTAGYIDGIQFDEHNNPLVYDILPKHPGSGTHLAFGEPERVGADFVAHWFMLRRPGQHRAVPEFRSTLNVGAASRRFRNATVASAESAAELNVLLKTQLTADEAADAVRPFATMDVVRRMLTAMPMGWDATQLKSEHPNATYEAFCRQQLNETARPKSMPYNLAAADSSSYNYASGRLDHQTYFSAIDVERLDADRLVLDKLFALWWAEAVLSYGWDSDPLAPPAHQWDWPKHPVADLRSEAQAVDIRLKNGSLSLSRAYSDCGLDFEDEIVRMAADFGITVPEMRARLLETLHPKTASVAPPEPPDDTDPGDPDDGTEPDTEEVEEEEPATVGA